MIKRQCQSTTYIYIYVNTLNSSISNMFLIGYIYVSTSYDKIVGNVIYAHILHFCLQYYLFTAFII